MARTDFFISYTAPDADWAEWIARVLEDSGFAVKFQKWDFVPGSNFVLEMQRAAEEAARTLAVLSPDYLKSGFGAAEWATAFAKDPRGFRRGLIPVRVRECANEGLLRTLVYVDLVGTEEDEAREKLLQAARGERAKPPERPAFPGAGRKSRAEGSPAFPGAGTSNVHAPDPTSPVLKVRRKPSDLDRRRFIEHAFGAIAGYFERALEELAAHDAGIACDFKPLAPTKFSAEVFVDGESRCHCEIWIGTRVDSNGIAYSEVDLGLSNDGAFNELLTIGRDDLALKSLMGLASGREAEGLDPQQLTPDGAARYLWRRFASRLE